MMEITYDVYFIPFVLMSVFFILIVMVSAYTVIKIKSDHDKVRKEEFDSLLKRYRAGE